MGALGSARVLAIGAAWQATKADTLGRALVHAVEDGGEDERTIAGMTLVRGGEHGRRLAGDALEAGSESEELVTVLQSIASPQAEAQLRALAMQDRPVAAAAERAVSELEELRRRGAL